MADKSHTYSSNYKNNSNWFNGKGVIISGVKFNDFSFFNDRPLAPVKGALYSPTGEERIQPTTPNIQNVLQKYANGTGSIDHMNKITSMMFINWNGAEITRGDFDSGETYEISTTPEFLSIFNNVTTILYENVAKYLKIDNRIKRQIVDHITTARNMTLGPNEPVGDNIMHWDDIEEYTINNLIISNTTNNEILITVNQGTLTTLSNTLEFKTPSGSGLYVMIRPYGFGEISFMRKGTKIYARGM